MGYSTSKIREGERNYNNIFNPMDSVYPCEDMIEEERAPERFKLFPTEEQFEYIKMYYNNPRVEMRFSEIFELTDDQFDELFKIHLKRLDPLNEYNSRNDRELSSSHSKNRCGSYIAHAYHFFDNFYRCTDRQNETLIKILKEANIEPDMSDSDDVYNLKRSGITDDQQTFRRLFTILGRCAGNTAEEKQEKMEEYYNEIFIPKFIELENKGLVGKRWFALVEEGPFSGSFSDEFIRQHANRFSVNYLLRAKMSYKELMKNDEFKKTIVKILEDDIKDELGVYKVDGVIDVNINFDLDQLALFKYLEDESDSKYDGGECCAGC